MILVNKSTLQYFGYSVCHLRDSRANRRHLLRITVDGVDNTLNRTYRMSWRRFKKAVLRDFLIRL